MSSDKYTYIKGKLIMFHLELVDVYIQNQIKEQLETFRFNNGRPFPHSYKEFASKYGYGLSLGLFFIYIPMKNYSDSIFVQSKSIKGTYQNIVDGKEDCWFDLGEITFEQLKNLYPFARSENSDYLFWDVESGTDEMDIYLTDFRGGFIHVANSLDNFFDKATNSKLFGDFPLKFSEPLPAIFKPYTIHFD